MKAMRRPSALASALSAAALIFSPAHAQDHELYHTVVMRGAVATAGDLQVADIVYTPQWRSRLPRGIDLTLSGLVRADFADELEPGNPGAQADIRSPWNRRVFIGDNVDLELRDAFVDLEAGAWFLRLGKQQVVWGQTDGLRVLDQVNPLSFREFILPDFEDRRIPLWMVNAERSIGPAMLQLLWIPDHSYDEVPREGVFAPTSPRLVPLLPGRDGGPSAIAPAERPDRLFVDDDFGVRLSGFNGGWDWSLNALYAYGDQAAFTLPEPAGEPLPALQYERTAFLGGSASNAFGKTVLRTELGLRTASEVPSFDPLTGRPAQQAEIGAVLGLDFSPDSDTLLSGQVFVSHLTGSDAPLLREPTELTTTLLLRRMFFHQRLTAEALWIHHGGVGDGLLQSSLDWQASDHLSASVGLDVFYGDEVGLFGQFGEADRLLVAIKRRF